MLVTGGAGFLGTWLVQRLIGEGASVTVLQRDIDPSGRFATEGVAEQCAVVHADVSDYDAVLAALNEHEAVRSSISPPRPSWVLPTAPRSPPSRPTYAAPTTCWRRAA